MSVSRLIVFVACLAIGLVPPAFSQPAGSAEAGTAEKAPAASPATGKPSAQPAPPAPTESPAVQTGPGQVDFQAIFTKANRAYLDGEYEQAIAGYKKLVEAGLVHPDLYFNLANTFYRAGKIGLAVLFYERTLALDPGDAAARSNLEIVRKELIDRVILSEGAAVGEPLWHGFIRGLNLNWLIWLFLVLWTLVFGLWSLRRLMARTALRRLVFWVSVPLVSVTLVLGLLLFARIYVQERVHHGVVVDPTTALREGPERNAKELMEVHAGLKVRLLNQVGDYVRVRLANGVEGFVLDRQLGRI